MTWALTRSGRAFDLLAPRAEDVDFARDVAPALAGIRRFAGHAGPIEIGYSVAQHCCIGAHALYAEIRSAEAALAFLLHDAHEYVIGDLTTPVMMALDRLAATMAGGRPSLVTSAKRRLADRIDVAIHEAAGLALPLPAGIVRAVADMDVRMLRRERDDLLPPSPKAWGEKVERARPLPAIIGRIEPMRPEDAVVAWLKMFEAFRAFRRQVNPS